MLSILIPNNDEKDIHEFVEEVERLLPAEQIIISSDIVGRGKGWALREALLHAQGDVIAFLDGDGDIPPRMMRRLIPFLEDFDVVVGSKRITNAPFHRRVITYLSRIYIRLMFGLNVDTQTGVKIFKREALDYWKIDGFSFDVEVLVNANERGFKMVEVPIEAEIRSSMSWKVLWKTLVDSLRIKFRS